MKIAKEWKELLGMELDFMQSAKEMYTGEILIIGDHRNPHDICILDDHYLDMYGLNRGRSCNIFLGMRQALLLKKTQCSSNCK